MQLSQSPSIENKKCLLEEIIINYYRFVDSADLDSLFSLFSKNIIYDRCEQKISGIDELKHFYKNVRKMNGVHTIIDSIFNDNKIAIRGIFNGKDRDGNSIKLIFSDFFELDTNNKITKRQTYLANGFDATR